MLIYKNIDNYTLDWIINNYKLIENLDKNEVFDQVFILF